MGQGRDRRWVQAGFQFKKEIWSHIHRTQHKRPLLFKVGSPISILFKRENLDPIHLSEGQVLVYLSLKREEKPPSDITLCLQIYPNFFQARHILLPSFQSSKRCTGTSFSRSLKRKVPLSNIDRICSSSPFKVSNFLSLAKTILFHCDPPLICEVIGQIRCVSICCPFRILIGEMWLEFPGVWKTFFDISFSVTLLIMNSFSFCMFQKPLCLSFLDIFISIQF